MSDQRETLKFGDPVVNIAASDDNPIKRGIFVRNVVRTGKLNAGRFVEYMTEDGATHLTPPDNIAQDGISAADEIASLRAQLAEANKKLVMADGTLALERGLGIDTHATMVALCQQLTAKHIKLEAQLASVRKALALPLAGDAFRALKAALSDEQGK